MYFKAPCFCSSTSHYFLWTIHLAAMAYPQGEFKMHAVDIFFLLKIEHSFWYWTPNSWWWFWKVRSWFCFNPLTNLFDVGVAAFVIFFFLTFTFLLIAANGCIFLGKFREALFIDNVVLVTVSNLTWKIILLLFPNAAPPQYPTHCHLKGT